MGARDLTPPARHGWPLLAILAVGILALVGALYAFTDPLGDNGGDQRTTYTEAIVGVPSRINPMFAHMSDVDRDISALVFSGLTRLENDGTPVGDLAEDWQVSDDGLTVTFNLRSGVTWHSGEPFTSDDVVFTYGFLADPDVQSDPEQTSLWQSVSCSAPDELTVECRLPEPYSPFLAYASVGILPEHILEASTSGSLFDDPFNQAPVGTGPYKLVSMDDAEATLEVHTGFHLGRPSIDEIRLRFYSDTSTAAASLLLGEADGLLLDLTVNPEDLRAIAELEGMSRHIVNRAAYTSLFLNNGSPLLSDQAVREATWRAVDTDSIVTGLLDGRAAKTSTPIVPGTWAYTDDRAGPTHDIGEARGILADAGWVIPEGKDVRERDGTELRLTITTDEDPLRRAIAEAISDDLSSIGIGVSVVALPSDQLVSNFLIPRLYQAAVFGWDPGVDPDPYPAWHSSQSLDGGRNLAGYTSEPADALMEQARREYDYEERRAIYAEFQDEFLADTPSVPLFAPSYTYIVSDDVRNLDVGVLFSTASRFGNVYEWTIETSSVIGG